MSELSSSLLRRLQADDDRVVFFDERWQYGAQLRRDVTNAQAALTRLGVGSGDRIMLVDENSYAFIVGYLAILLCGACVVPVNPHMPAPELIKVAGRSQAAGAVAGRDVLRTVFTDPGLRDVNLRFVAELGVGPDGVFLAGTGGADGPPGGSSPAAELGAGIGEDAGALLLFTSGTTGAPKGVQLTHRQVMATVHNVIGAHNLTERDITYLFLPLFHINAEVIGLLATLVSGGKLIVEKKFSASRFWPVIQKHGVTWVSAVPTVIGILIKAATYSPAPRHLRFVRSASAPLPSLQGRRFEAMFNVPVIESYGMTEAASQICVNPVPPAARRHGSVGRPYGVDLKVVGSAGRTLEANEIGEIAIRGDSVIREYASGDASGNGFVDGWFMTGDIGCVDPDGFVYITGRSKEMINRAGQKISPREVEEVIARDPDVRTVAVIGLPDDLYGERVVAYVVPEDAAVRRQETGFKERLRQLCAKSISAYKCPVEYHVVDEIPLGPTGKIQRTRLREQVLAVSGAN